MAAIMNYPISEHKIISVAELNEKDARIADLERELAAMTGLNDNLLQEVARLRVANAELEALAQAMTAALEGEATF